MEVDGEADIVKKYKKYPEFKRDMDEIQLFYNSSLNLSIYENLEKEESLKIFEVIEHENKDRHVIVYYGHRYKGVDSRDL